MTTIVTIEREFFQPLPVIIGRPQELPGGGQQRHQDLRLWDEPLSLRQRLLQVRSGCTQPLSVRQRPLQVRSGSVYAAAESTPATTTGTQPLSVRQYLLGLGATYWSGLKHGICSTNCGCSCSFGCSCSCGCSFSCEYSLK